MYKDNLLNVAIVVLALILLFTIGCGCKELWENVPYTGRRRVNNKRVGKRARYVTNTWANSDANRAALHKTMRRFNVPIHPTDDYYNYCQLKLALGNCNTNGQECRDECY